MKITSENLNKLTDTYKQAIFRLIKEGKLRPSEIDYNLQCLNNFSRECFWPSCIEVGSRRLSEADLFYLYDKVIDNESRIKITFAAFCQAYKASTFNGNGVSPKFFMKEYD